MIASPAYSGKVNVQFAAALSDTRLLLESQGIRCTLRLTSGSSLLVAERNRILEMFWQSDCTHLLTIDADLGWPAQAVLAMLDSNEDFIAGLYPARGAKEFLFWPVKNEDGTIVQKNHLLKMDYIPAGFMMLSKNAIKKMRDHFPELYYTSKDPKSESTFALFNTELHNGHFWGEDYVFCRRAREAGLEIWIDPLIQFDHDGNIGCVSELFERKKECLL
jgi:hypothetical protein